MAAERRILAASVFCFVVAVGVCLQVSIPQDVYEHARGDNITIPCNFKPQNPVNPLVIVTWTSEGDKPGDKELSILTYYSTLNTVDVTPRYERRAALDFDLKTGKVNLKLSSITLQDNRVYECRIAIPKDDSGILADTTRLVVLVAPSLPVCDIQGKAEYGQNINLTCKSEEGSPPPVYKWDSRDVRNTPRAKHPRTTEKDGILSLFNLTMETSGYYTCTSANKIRSTNCSITLTVMPPSMNAGLTGGLIALGIAALLILIIIIYCCCCRKKNKEDEEYTMGVPDGAEFSDKEEPTENGVESRRDDRSERHEERRHDDRRDEERDYDDRRSDYTDRRSDYDDRRSDYTDRRSDYGDGRSDRYPDRRDDRDDRDRRDRHDDRRDRDDDRYDEPHDDRYDDRYDDGDRPPSVPANKPARMDYDD